MNKFTSYILVGLTLSATLCISCVESGNTKYAQGKAAYACDESFKPVIEEERELFSVRYPDAELDTIYTNESNAFKLLKDGKAYMIIATRDFKPEEKEYLKHYGSNPASFIIAYDGLAIIENKNNTDSLITVDNIKKILSGQVSDWKEVYPSSTAGKIQVVFDNATSSNVHFAEDSILGGKAISKVNAVATNSSAAVIKYVEENRGAIGIIGSNWLNDKRDSTNLTFCRNIRTMRVSKAQNATLDNSFLPYQAYFYTDEYAFTRTIYALTNDPRRGPATTFKNYLMSQNQGQLVFLKAGLLPAYGHITFKEVHIK